MYSIEQVKTSAAACRYELIRPFNKRNSSITIGARFNFNGRRISQFIPCSSLKTSNPPQTFYPFVIMSMVEFYVVKKSLPFCTCVDHLNLMSAVYKWVEQRNNNNPYILYIRKSAFWWRNSFLFKSIFNWHSFFDVFHPAYWLKNFLFYFYHQCNNCV